MTARPESDEHDPYYRKYIDRVPDGDIAATLASQIENTLSFLRTESEENAGRAYAEGKWTIKQVLGHLIDTERLVGRWRARSGAASRAHWRRMRTASRSAR